MSTDFHTVHEDDPLSLVANLMDWHRIRQVLVEDGHGHLVGIVSYRALLKLLARYPHLRGILFDQPHVAEAAKARIQAAGLGGRCLAEGGDFFVSVPSGGDAYILSLLLHDWDEERSVTILKNIRRGIAPNGRLLVVELVLPEGEAPFFGKWLDLHMAVLLGARERTANEFRELFAASGFKLQRIVPTSTGMSIVEAVPV